METRLNIKGMHCKNCEKLISKALLELNGVNKVKVDYTTEKALITFDENIVSTKSILAKVEDAGYESSVSEDKGDGARKKFLGLF